MDAFAGTGGDLLDEVAEDLVVVWKNYAMAPDAHLSPKALELKRGYSQSLKRSRLERAGMSESGMANGLLHHRRLHLDISKFLDRH